MRRLLFALVSSSTTALAAGTELEQVRAALATFTARESTQASVTVTRWERVTGEKTKEASAGAVFFVSATKSAVSVSCNESQLVPTPPTGKGEAADVLRSINSAEPTSFRPVAG
jgi:hypothetical protein